MIERRVNHTMVATIGRMPITVFGMRGILGHRRERIEAVVAGGPPGRAKPELRAAIILASKRIRKAQPPQARRSPASHRVARVAGVA
jgi:hypothetical protein